MSEPYIGEIKMFAGSYAPRSWALCDGASIPIEQNAPLFILLGDTYGGDKKTNFSLPDLRGRIPIHRHLEDEPLECPMGKPMGHESVILASQQVPLHTHKLMAMTNDAVFQSPSDNVLAAGQLYSTQNPDCDMNVEAISESCGSEGHSNIQPFLCINFIIATLGVYPHRD